MELAGSGLGGQTSIFIYLIFLINLHSFCRIGFRSLVIQFLNFIIFGSYSRNELMLHLEKNTDSLFNAEANICNQDLVLMGKY